MARPVEAGLDNPAGHVAGARTFYRYPGAGLELDTRYRFASELELGLLVEATYLDKGYLSGHAVSPVFTSGAALVLLAPMTSSGSLELFVRYVPGIVLLQGLESAANAVRQSNEVGVFAHWLLGDAGLLRVVLGAELEIDPTVELADQSQAITWGYGQVLSEHWLVYVDVTSGGTFGFNGDNGKAILEGSIGVRTSFGSGGSRGAF